MQPDEIKAEKAKIESHIISLMQIVDEELFKYRALFNKVLEECHSQSQ